MIYLLFFGCLYIFSLIESSVKNISIKQKQILLFLSFLFFVFIAGFRYKTGYDWNAYMTYFNRIDEPNILSRMEIGYGFLNLFFKTTFNNFHLMNLTINVVCTLILFKFCKRYSVLPITTLLFYAGAGGFFFSYNMGLTRQYIALSISLLTVHFIFQQKKISAIISLIIAFLFHKSAFITLLYFICYKIKLTKSIRLFCVGITIFLTLWGNFIIRNFLTFFFDLSFLPSFIVKYKPYIYNSIWSTQAEFSSGLGYFTILLMLIVVFFLYHNETYSVNFIFNAVLVGLFIASFGRNINILGRLAKYFDIFNMFIFIYLIEIIRSKSKIVLFPAIFMIMLLYCILIPYKFTKGISPVDGQSNWSMFYPWQSFILPVENAERNERMQRINQFR